MMAGAPQPPTVKTLPQGARPVRKALLACLCASLVLLVLLALNPPITGVAWLVRGMQLLAAVAIYESMFWPEPAGRRPQWLLALALVFAAWTLQRWGLLSPLDEWRASGMPAPLPWAQWPARIEADLAHLASLRWVRGLSHQPVWVSLVLVPLCGVALIGQATSGVLPAHGRWVAKATLLLWGLALTLACGQWVRAASGVPTAVFVLGLVALPWLAASAGIWPAAVLLFICLGAVLSLLVEYLLPVPVLLDALFALALLLSLVAGAYWTVFMNAATPIPPADPSPNGDAPPAPDKPFDLIQHLDSPSAQEGADKYTRE